MSYIWTLIDEGGLVEVNFLMSETPVVNDIHIIESGFRLNENGLERE
jgi:hypothetical protein